MLIFLGLTVRLLAQPAEHKSVMSKEVLARINAKLDQEGGDTVRYFILEEIRKHCRTDYDCLYAHYDDVLAKLEREFKHISGIRIAEEMAALARLQGDTDREAQALRSLISLHGFLHNFKADVSYRKELIALYEKTGNTEAALYEKTSLLEGRAWYLGEGQETMLELEATLQEAMDKGFIDMANKLRIRLKYICEEFGLEGKLVEQIEALERVPLSTPLHHSEYRIAFHAASGRGDLFLKAGQYEQAEQYYQKALHLYKGKEEKSDHETWLEIYALHRLAKLAWERQDIPQAKAWLDQAYAIAEAFNMHDRLALNLGMRVDIAVEEQNFADAYHFTQDRIRQEAIRDSLAGGFDIEKYYIKAEKKRLEAEATRQALELRLNQSRLNSTLIITVLALLLALGLFIGFYWQRLSKRKVAAQYRLIQQQAEQLQQLDAAKSRFFANVSHELRTPLTLISGPISLLLKTGPWQPEQETLLRTIQQSSGQLSLLVNDILDLRKLEISKMEVQLQPTPVAAFFRRHFAQFESKAEQQGITYEMRWEVGEEIMADLDQAKCQQMVNNLLSNAFEFTPVGGRIEVALSLADGWLELSVADSGVGIPADDLPRVFDRFFQSSRPEQPAQGGTGIGLALCKEYAELLGGAIKAESQVGEGSTFRIAFPLTGIRTAPLPEAPLPIPGTAVSTMPPPAKRPSRQQPLTLPALPCW